MRCHRCQPVAPFLFSLDSRGYAKVGITKAFRTGWPGLGGLLLAFSWPASAQFLERATIDTWATTTYYLGYAEFADKADGGIRITAGGRYSLYLNGDLVGADDDPGSVETYEASFKKRTNMVAVVVEHDGTDSGYGLFSVLEAEGVLLPSSPTDRLNQWFWTDFPLENEEDAAWTKLKLNKLDEHEEDGQAVIWSPVQVGTLDPKDFADFADLDLTRARSVAGFPGGLDGSRGGVRLRSFEGHNIALNTFTNDPKIIDGNIETNKNFSKGRRALFEEVEINLGRLFPINRVRVITAPPSGSKTYEDNSLRGYSILVSKDGVSYQDVGARNQITTFRETEIDFSPIIARYVRMVVTEFANRDAAPLVGEIEAFGEGIDQQGTYLSPPLNLGTDEVKNFDRALWYGVLPSIAEVDIRFRSGDDGENWSAWSAWSQEPEILLTVPEPRRFLQYQLLMQTSDPFEGPRLDSLVVLYSGSLPAAQALASVVPTQVSIGVDTTFTYTLGLEVGNGEGIARLVILTPWPAQLDIDAVQGALIDAERTYATNDSLVIAFDPPISADTELEIPFKSRLLSASHSFQGLLYAPDAVSPLLVQEREGEDPLTGLAYSVASEAVDFEIPILQDVRPFPGAFSPNGDGINDQVALGFTLGRVSNAPVRLEIYDLGGNLLRTLSERRLNAGLYAPRSGRGVELPVSWDGRAENGEILPPGLYLYRLVVDLEPEDETATGVVGIAY